MSDRTIEFGDPPNYVTGEGGEDAPDGNFVVAQVAGGGTKLLEYDGSAFQIRGDVDASGQDIDVDTLNATAVNAERTVIEAGDLESALSVASAGDTIILSQDGPTTVTSTISSSLDDITIIGGNLKLADGSDTDLVEFTGDNVTLKHSRLDGNKANNSSQSGSCVVFKGQNCSALGNVIKNASRHNIYYRGISETIDGFSAAFNTLSGAERTNISVEGPNAKNGVVGPLNRCYGSGQTNISLEDGTSESAAIGNIAYSGDKGIGVFEHGDNACQKIMVANNICRDNADKGILIDQAVAGEPSENFQVLGNQIYNSNQGIILVSAENNLEYVVVSSNISRDNATSNYDNFSSGNNVVGSANLGFTV